MLDTRELESLEVIELDVDLNKDIPCTLISNRNCKLPATYRVSHVPEGCSDNACERCLDILKITFKFEKLKIGTNRCAVCGRKVPRIDFRWRPL